MSQLEKSYKIEDNYCQSIEEVIVSKSFEKCFTNVVSHFRRYNLDYYSSIFSKLKKKECLSEEEKRDFIDMLNMEDVKDFSTAFIKKLGSNFTLEQALIFLKQYHYPNIRKKLVSMVSENVSSIVEEKQYDILDKGNGYLLLKSKVSNKKIYIKSEELKESYAEEDFVFDNVGKINHEGDFVYYRAKIGNKEGIMKIGDELFHNKIIIFDEITLIESKNGNIYYQVKIGDKFGFIKYGEEQDYNTQVKYKKIEYLEDLGFIGFDFFTDGEELIELDF